MRTSLNKFLEISSRLLKNKSSNNHIIFCLGNESGDVDSVVSSIAFSYFLHHFKHEKNNISKIKTKKLFKTTPDLAFLYQNNFPVEIIPVLNFRRKHFNLRKDVKSLLETAEIDTENIVFCDDISLTNCEHKMPTSFCLVDHNRLAPDQMDLSDRVVFVVDHHLDEKRNGLKEDQKIIEKSASCATLITKVICNFNMEHLLQNSKSLRKLLEVAILLDSSCLEDVHKVTEDDRKYLDLVSDEGKLVVKELYQTFFDLRCDLSGLSTEEVLQKDLKTVRLGDKSFPLNLCVSSVPLSLQSLQKLGGKKFYTGLARFLRDRKQCLGGEVITVLMTTFEENKVFKRQLVLFFESSEISRETSKRFCVDFAVRMGQEVALTFSKMKSEISCGNDSCGYVLVVFDQRNVSFSRKKVLPLLAESIAQNDIWRGLFKLK